MSTQDSTASARHHDEAGITLIEVIIYSLVASVILGLMATLFAGGFRSVAETGDRDAATGKAQLVNESIQASVRNATALSVSGSLVRAKVVTGGSSFECRAWALTPSGNVVYETSAAAIPAGSYTGWTTLASGTTGTLSGGAAFAVAGDELQLGLSVAVGEAIVPISSAVSAQAKSETAGPACW